MAPNPRYHAFISYSHAADEQLAARLQHALQQFAKPFYALRALDVFRDQTDLTVNPALWSRIESALDTSEYFLLFASPRAAQSKWVKREIDHWLRKHDGPRNLLILWTDGSLLWGKNDFDWTKTDALPHTLDWNPDDSDPRKLAGAFGEQEPMHLDLRWTREQSKLSDRDPKFLDHVATIAAELHHQPKRDLIGRDVTEHARLRRWSVAAITALVILTIAAGIFGLMARYQAGIAQRRQKEAEEAAAVALSRQLAAQSQERGAEQLDLSLLLAIAATRTSNTEQARAGLFDALQRAGHVSTFLMETNRNFSDVAFSPDGSLIVVADNDGDLTAHDVRSGKQVAGALHNSPIYAMAVDRKSSRLLTAGRDGIRLWRLPSLEAVDQIHAPLITSLLAISPDGAWIAAASGSVQLLNLMDRTWSEPIGARDGHYVRAVDFHPDGRVIAFSYDDGDIEVWDRVARTRLQQLRGHDTPFISQTSSGAMTRTDASVDALAFSPDGETLATGGYDGRVVFWDWQRGRQKAATAPRERSPVRDVAFSSDGSTLYAGTSGGSVQAFSAIDGAATARAVAAHQGQITAIDVAGSRLASVGWDGLVLLWDFDHWSVGKHLPLPTDEPRADSIQKTMVLDLVVAPHVAVTSSVRHPLRLWDLDHPSRSRALPAPTGAHFLAMAGDALVYLDSTDRLLRRDLKNVDAPPVLVAQLHGIDDMTANGTRVAAANLGGGVETIDLSTGARTHKDVPVVEECDRVLLSKDGATLASHSDEAVLVVDVASGKELLRKPVQSASIALSPDGRLLAVNRYQFTDVWDIRTAAVRHTIDHVDRGVQPGLTFSPDSRVLVTFGSNYQPAFRDMQSGLQTLQIRNPVELSGSVHTFSADMKTFIESHSDGSISIWDIDPSSWERIACRIANRSFTADELRRYGSSPALKEVCAP